MATVGRMVKEAVVQELTAQLAERPNVFVTRLGVRLTAPESDALRRQLAGVSARMWIISRRLGQRALTPWHGGGLATLLQGSVGLVLVGEAVVPAAKLIEEFVRTHEEQLAISGAVVDGQLLDRAKVEVLAKLPSRAVLLTEVVFGVESALTSVVMTVEQVLGDVAWVVEQAATTQPVTSDQ